MILPLVIGVLLGGIVGVIAEQKNRSFFPWAIYGFFFFFFAIIHIAIIGDKGYENRQLEGMGYKKCPACAEMVRAEALLCKHCNTKLAGGATAEGAGQAGVTQNEKKCRWCQETLGDIEANKCPSCGGLQRHFLKDNQVLLVLLFLLMFAFLAVLTQVGPEQLEAPIPSESLSSF